MKPIFKDKETLEYLIVDINDGILTAEYKEGKIQLEDAIKVVAERLKYSEGYTYPIVATSIQKVEIDKRARNYFQSEEGSKGLSAIALLYKKSYTLVLLNFMLRLHKPKVPVQLFSDEKKALSWLEQFK